LSNEIEIADNFIVPNWNSCQIEIDDGSIRKRC